MTAMEGIDVAAPNSAMTPAYAAIDARLKAGGIVVLDGGIGSELQFVGYPEKAEERPASSRAGSRRATWR